MRMVHYRRIEKVSNNKTYSVGNYNVLRIHKKINEFFNFNIDNFLIE